MNELEFEELLETLECLTDGQMQKVEQAVNRYKNEKRETFRKAFQSQLRELSEKINEAGFLIYDNELRRTCLDNCTVE